MTEDSSQEEDVEAALGAALLGDPELSRLRARLAAGGAGSRRRAKRLEIERAVLELAGERGYEETTVEAILARTATNRTDFYGAFADKEHCFASAYGNAGEALCERILARCGQAADWRAGMRAALEDLGELMRREPAVCRALLDAAAPAAPVAAKREEVVGRLSRAIDRARRETDPSRHPSPPFTSRFILSAIEAGALRFLGERGEADLAEHLRAMLYLAVASYYGPQEARRAAAEIGA